MHLVYVCVPPSLSACVRSHLCVSFLRPLLLWKACASFFSRGLLQRISPLLDVRACRALIGLSSKREREAHVRESREEQPRQNEAQGKLT